MLEDEATIVARAREGEAQAFGVLYDHYQPQIYRFIFLKVSRREEAEDLTHQVFLSAWKNVRGYENLGHPFSSWLYQIARNQVIDHYRVRKPEVDLEAIEAQQLATHENHEATLDGRLEIEKVRHAMKELSQEYQDVIIMRFVEELSVRETAEALGKSEGSVKVMQHRAIKELKKILGEKE